ncbi:30S ribosomal protein S6 [candidate division WOR-1 bacterium RIFOXYA12_FULL_52_29]|uniref:Small ribosomal subunit protein bS6 n=1 Tax=candidate division WOR-1 bacterium RIFOXYC12_FULL_54_18 TaxID=1802584 RepID=A0A1F4T6I8_UNCSA|nr:MAG: 30S ribosomal protein S6 [Alphaproteobacteria bacterium RIFOXYD12_FULL_60_8]OGC11910.1 MAG: 30S ribosomal protein S6 [candidate division WOR-1 bacterium RIFOXYA2_FULL_51_19]OGC17984.1 MAG: 30S ribosomal protein S6 [candidate division WOR-1 bacterium RIFOXYA12_FULL_52_29]OGC26840.1 MAG: 30S ribosomal protein S6 [candidate division WOR-1 bacterium RIFOXYB2_FULL_45_9]OGC28401.1 MAG: 30S ribosomal protein S6 [candidate division WOR-1 bacterium RIFOXYC12_FULL_54_18]OGC31144.1 MAG: 30S ribos
MKAYELIMIMDPILGEEKIGLIIDKISDKINSVKGEIDSIEKWGVRRLNSIFKKAKRQTNGYYVLIRLKGPANLPAEVKALLKVTENVTRYFLTNAFVQTEAPVEKKEIVGTPLEPVNVGEIKGEAVGES